jgi:hypothetical protein
MQSNALDALAISEKWHLHAVMVTILLFVVFL